MGPKRSKMSLSPSILDLVPSSGCGVAKPDSRSPKAPPSEPLCMLTGVEVYVDMGIWHSAWAIPARCQIVTFRLRCTPYKADSLCSAVRRSSKAGWTC